MTIKEYVKAKKLEMKNLVLSMSRLPKLVIVQINEDEASYAYIRGKLKDAAELGINAELIKLPLETTEAELLKKIDELKFTQAHSTVILPQVDSEVLKKLKIEVTTEPEFYAHKLYSK